jgi:hypothetical protein
MYSAGYASPAHILISFLPGAHMHVCAQKYD